MTEYIVGNALNVAITLLISIPSAIAIVMWIFKRLGGRWLDNKFAKNLEDHKHTLRNDSDRIRLEFNKDMDRASNFHQREYEELPKVWVSLCDAVDAIGPAVNPIQMAPPQITSMPKHALFEFLKEIGFTDSQCEIVSSQEKGERIRHFRIINIYNKGIAAHDAYMELMMKLRKSSIFLPEDLIQQFYDVTEIMYEALRETDNAMQSLYENKDLKESWRARAKFADTSKKLVSILSRSVHNRLTPSDLETHP